MTPARRSVAATGSPPMPAPTTVNTILLNTRERIRDTAMLKAIGMTPKQVLVMVATSAGVLALIGGLAAPPSGVAFERVLLDVISSAAGNDTPAATNVAAVLRSE